MFSKVFSKKLSRTCSADSRKVSTELASKLYYLAKHKSDHFPFITEPMDWWSTTGWHMVFETVIYYLLGNCLNCRLARWCLVFFLYFAQPLTERETRSIIYCFGLLSPSRRIARKKKRSKQPIMSAMRCDDSEKVNKITIAKWLCRQSLVAALLIRLLLYTVPLCLVIFSAFLPQLKWKTIFCFCRFAWNAREAERARTFFPRCIRP